MGDNEEESNSKRGRNEGKDVNETDAEASEPPAKVARKTDNVGESDVTQDVEAEDAEPDSSSEKKQDGTSNAVPPQADTADDFAAAADDFAAAKPEGKEDDDSENDPEPASAADSDPACASTSEPEVTDGDAEESEPQANVPSFEETGGVSGLPPGALSELPDAPVNPAQAATVLNPESIVEERAELATELVGRVIGKGGEMIRDLQARSGCRVDVDQNVPADSPKIITYRGTRRAVNLAKELVETLCSQEGKRDTDLPLGMATRRQLIVPSSSIGKIIGRGGEMIRDLQNRSKGKIQVDHTGEGVTDPSTRRLTVTGTQEAVTKAEEMIMFLVANPQMDAAQAIDMLVDDKTRGGGTWGSGPPYTNLPNQGQGMQVGPGYGGGGHAAAQYGGGEGGGYAAPYGGGGYAAQYGGSGYAAPYGGGGYAAPYGGGGYAAPYGGGGYQQTPGAYGGSAAAGTEVEIFYAAKMYMGRLIGSRGVTINDVQKQSGCDIQINQDVPPGQDCEISIKGSRQGIEMAKGMLRDIIEMGPDHPYAGGTGGGASQQASYGGVGYPQRGSYDYSQGPPMQAQTYNYQQQGPQQAQYGAYPYGAPTYDYQQAPMYGHQEMPQYQAAPPQQYTMPPQAQYGAYSQPPPMQQQAPAPTTWRSTSTEDGQIYYYNEKTGETQWEKPMGM